MDTETIRAYVLAFLWEAHKRHTSITFLGMADRIADKSGFTHSTAKKHVSEAIDMGLVENGGGGLKLTAKGQERVEGIKYNTSETF